MRTASQMRRVLVVTYEFPPSMEMGAQACAQIARYLPLYGWEPAVLTVRERYVESLGVWSEQAFPGHVVRTNVIPHPSVLYRRLKARLRFNHHQVSGGGSGLEEDNGTLRRWVLSLLLIGDAYTGWLPPAIVAGLKVIRRGGADHLFSSGPPWTSHLVALALSWMTKLPWTAHFRDPWGQGQRCKPVSLVSRRIDGTLENMILRRAASVVCVTDRHTEMLRQIHPELPSSKFVTIPNGFDEAEWEHVEPSGGGANPRRQDKFVIVYAGQLYHARNPLPLFRALRALIEAGDIDGERVQVELLGWSDVVGRRRVTDMAADSGIGERVSLRGPLGRAETLQKLAKADLLLLLAEGLTAQIPGKTYEYLRAGRPILALTSDGAVAELLRRAGGSWVVDPADETGIGAAVREAYRLWRDGLPLPSADRRVVSGFDRRLLAGRFADLFDKGSSGISA